MSTTDPVVYTTRRPWHSDAFKRQGEMLRRMKAAAEVAAVEEAAAASEESAVLDRAAGTIAENFLSMVQTRVRCEQFCSLCPLSTCLWD